MESRQTPPAQASSRQTELGDMFDRTLFLALDALEERKIPYAIIGGIAASGLGRPRSTHDIDFFVRPEDAEAALEALGRHGFDTERTDARWLFKGWKEQMMVDIIFKSQGDIYFDDEMHRRAKPMDYHGRRVPTVSPEDLVIIKCAVHNEAGPHHWHDALAVLSHATVDWPYLLKRARRAPRRLLALLIYAQSNDIWIPNNIIHELFASVFGAHRDPHVAAPAGMTPSKQVEFPVRRVQPESVAVLGATLRDGVSAAYLSQNLREAIAGDERTASLDIHVTLTGNKIIAKGEVLGEERRQAIEKVIREHAPGYEIENQVKSCELTAPEGVEEVV